MPTPVHAFRILAGRQAPLDSALRSDHVVDALTRPAVGQAPRPDQDELVAGLELDDDRAGILRGVVLAVPGLADAQDLLGRAE